jgi:hypothetical protein
MIVHSYVSFAFLDHYATSAIVQHAIVYKHKSFTLYNMSIT